MIARAAQPPAHDPAPAARTLALPDAEIRFVEAGPAGAPALLLLHGLGGSHADWDAFIGHFAAQYRVIAPDLRGSGESRGRSRPRGPFTIAELAGDVAALLDHLGAMPAHVVGWSLGGMIAFQLAVDRPAAVRSLAIVNSGPDWTPKSAPGRLAGPVTGLVALALGPTVMGRGIARRLFPRPDQAALRARYLERMARNERHAYAALLDAIVRWSVAPALGRLAMPALIVASDGDYLSTPAEKRAWAAMMPRARVEVLADSRHALPFEDPDRLRAVLGSFLDELARPA